VTTGLYGANGGNGRRVILAAVQTTEGTAETLDPATDYKAYLTCAVKPAREVYERRIVSPEQHGYPSENIDERVDLEVVAEIVPQTIGPADDTDRPFPHEMLVSSGWNLTSEVASKTHTYVLTSDQEGLLTLGEYLINAQNTATRLTELYNARGDFELSTTDEGSLQYRWTGMGLNSTPTAPRTIDLNPWADALNNLPGATLRPLQRKGQTVRIYDQAGTTLYGGGSLASPGTAGALLSWSLKGQRNPVARKTVSATSGIQGVMLNPGGASLEMVLEVNDIDLATWCVANKMIQVRITIPQPSLSDNTATLVCWGQIVDLDDTQITDGRYVAAVTLQCVYPPDLPGNSPQAGQQPLQDWTTTTNQGVPVIPVAGLPKGLVALQFKTA